MKNKKAIVVIIEGESDLTEKEIKEDLVKFVQIFNAEKHRINSTALTMRIPHATMRAVETEKLFEKEKNRRISSLKRDMRH